MRSHFSLPDTAYSQDVQSLSVELGEPGLSDMIRRFLYDQIYAGPDFDADDVDPDEWPEFQGRLSVHSSASVLFYSPSELSGPGGMHREYIRSTDRWYNARERRDTALVQVGTQPDDRLDGMFVCRVLRFISFVHDHVLYPCALVNWFIPDEEPDEVTGMWIVRPEKVGRRRSIGLIHLECFVRACHLLPVFGNTRIPHSFQHSDSLSAFKAFYLNQFIDYHSHECIPST